MTCLCVKLHGVLETERLTNWGDHPHSPCTKREMERTHCSNYWGISLLSLPTKVWLEKM